VYQQADDLHLPFIDHSNFDLLRQTPAVIGGYKWCAIPWQHELGVPVMYSGLTNNRYGEPDAAIRHRLPGEHHLVNKFLFDHIVLHQL
jgi:hypothetical protein